LNGQFSPTAHNAGQTPQPVGIRLMSAIKRPVVKVDLLTSLTAFRRP
jgi:hypothetical protein